MSEPPTKQAGAGETFRTAQMPDPTGGGGGAVDSVNGAAPISVDNTDPANPIVGIPPSNPSVGVYANGYMSAAQATKLAGLVQGVGGVTGTTPITVDNTDPVHPVVGIQASSPSQAGSMSAAQATKLAGLTQGVTGVTGTSPVTVDNTNPLTPVVGIQASSPSQAGSMSAAQATKLAGLTQGVTGVTGTSPITVDNTNPLTPVVGIQASDTSHAGSMSAAQATKLANLYDLQTLDFQFPIINGGTSTDPIIDIAPSSATDDGSMSSADWKKLNQLAATSVLGNATSATAPAAAVTAAADAVALKREGGLLVFEPVFPSDISASGGTVDNNKIIVSQGNVGSWQVAPTQPAVKTVATSNVALSGLQTVNGYTLTGGDRILLTAQTNPIENGYWNAAVGAWSRDFSAAANGQIAGGQTVFVTNGTYAGTTWVCTFTTLWIPGTSSATFAEVVNDNYGLLKISDVTGTGTTASVSWTSGIYRTAKFVLTWSGAVTVTGFTATGLSSLTYREANNYTNITTSAQSQVATLNQANWMQGGTSNGPGKLEGVVEMPLAPLQKSYRGGNFDGSYSRQLNGFSTDTTHEVSGLSFPFSGSTPYRLTVWAGK